MEEKMKERYKKYDLKGNMELALNYLEQMVDKDQDFLPYWLVVPHGIPAYAKHCRVDDAELVASWYEAVVAAQDVLGAGKGEEVKQGFYRHLMKSWGADGLRYHEKYPWTHTMHSSFHEMGYVLSALNRIILNQPNNEEVLEKGKNLVKAMRDLVIQRKRRTFWSGDFYEEAPIYEFPNDVYLQEGGFELECHTGRGEQPIRNGVILQPLVVFWELTGDEVALDLAQGIANHLIGASKFFNYKMEFFGHVHSVAWIAIGMIRLGRLTNNETYLSKGKKIFDYIVSISSSFGWVPEYAQLHDPAEEFCETCCIKDMVEGAKELIDAGYEEYYELIDKYARNMLDENQLKDGTFAPVDATAVDTQDTTYTNISERIVGGFTGGSEPGSISITKFRSLAGCCAGTGPQALQIIWNTVVEKKEDELTINLPMDITLDDVVQVETFYPNEGKMVIVPAQTSSIKVRVFDWMKNGLRVLVNGIEVEEVCVENNMIIVGSVEADCTCEIIHQLETIEKKEMIRGREYTVTWRGSDVVELSPKAEHIRLFQRDLSIPRYYPTPEDIQNPNAEVVAVPTA